MSSAIPPSALAVGIGLRPPHVRHVIDTRPDVPWFEVHSENHFVDGGVAIQSLLEVRETYPVALHGVGMSIGSVDPLDTVHLEKLVRLIERVDPWLVSEHLCFGGVDGRRVAAAVKQNGHATPVILLTGWGERMKAEDDVPSGVDCVLSKPPKLKEVRAALAQCCAEAALSKAG